MCSAKTTKGAPPGRATPNPTPVYAFLNLDGRFERHLIARGWGVHERRVLPERRDGSIIIYAADEIQPQKFDGMNTYLHDWMIAPRR